MKITKKTSKLTESAKSIKKLLEADEESKAIADTLANNDNTGTVDSPSAASVDQISNEIKSAAIADTDGKETIDDSAAKEVAKEVKDIGDQVDADSAVIAQPFKLDTDARNQTYTLNNRITKHLNRAWREAKRGEDDEYGAKSYSYPNVLIVGLPGSGKTAIVKNWARSVGANLVELDAKNDDLKYMINGYVVQDPNDPFAVAKAASTALADLNKPNSVLFLDEFNRQTNQAIRGSILSLIQDHTLLGKNNESVVFPNFLFTIVCANPVSRTDKGATPFFGAELNRFKHQLFDEDSDPAVTKEYLEARYAKGPSCEVKKIIDYVNKKYNGKFDSGAIAEIELALRQNDLGQFILNHDDFKYDDFNTYETATYEQRNGFSQRTLTNAIESLDTREKAADGTWTVDAEAMVEDFKDDLTATKTKRSTMNLDPKTQTMLINILDDYNIPSKEYLFSHSAFPEIRDLAVQPAPKPTPTPTQTPTTNEPNGGTTPDQEEPETTGPDTEGGESGWNTNTAQKTSNDANTDWGGDVLEQSINDWFN